MNETAIIIGAKILNDDTLWLSVEKGCLTMGALKDIGRVIIADEACYREFYEAREDDLK